MSVLIVSKPPPPPPSQNVVVQNCLHGHIADSPTVSTATGAAISVADARHAHTADALSLTATQPPQLTALGAAAATLSAGQCRKFADLSVALLEPDAADFIKYGSSGVYDPIRRQARYIGRRESINFRYRALMYDEASDVWSNTWPLWTTATASNGHGYDHNAIDQAAGTHYFREYNDPIVHVWNNSWSTLPGLNAAEVAGSLTWFPGVGLLYSDRRRIALFNNGAWTQLASFGQVPSAYHAVSEYNAAANVMLFGAGNADDALRRLSSSLVITNAATPPFNVGSSELQGLITADPASEYMICWRKESAQWAQYHCLTDIWSPLQQSSGSGANPQTGLPNLDTSASGRPTIAIPISAHGVIMYVQSTGSGGEAWLYRHSANNALFELPLAA